MKFFYPAHLVGRFNSGGNLPPPPRLGNSGTKGCIYPADFFVWQRFDVEDARWTHSGRRRPPSKISEEGQRRPLLLRRFDRLHRHRASAVDEPFLSCSIGWRLSQWGVEKKRGRGRSWGHPMISIQNYVVSSSDRRLHVNSSCTCVLMTFAINYFVEENLHHPPPPNICGGREEEKKSLSFFPKKRIRCCSTHWAITSACWSTIHVHAPKLRSKLFFFNFVPIKNIS